MNKYLKFGINMFSILLVTIALIIANDAVKTYESVIDSVLAPAIVDTESLEKNSAKGKEMANRIMEEGAVLLQNNDNTLPLNYSQTKKVNVFGWRSVDWIHGSAGYNASGGVSTEDGSYDSTVDLLEALQSYGIQYNKRLEEMYKLYSEPDLSVTNIKAQHINKLTPLREPHIDNKKYYSEDLLSYSENFSDTAIVVIGRMTGENMNCDQTRQIKEGEGATTDTTRHYLEISTEEEALLTYVGKNYDKVVVLLNIANPFECGFLKTIPGLDSCMYIGFTGTTAVTAIPKLLYGEVSPSGHTVDTFAYDMFTNPANTFSLPLKYADYNRNYLDLIENIYVGYRWYETADAEGYWDSYSNEYGEKYDAVVQYPFGYGLTYNNYEWEVQSFSLVPGSSFTDKDMISVSVKVTNKGMYPGREVVSIYVTPPYTKGGIEKSVVSLVAFGKTNLLNPGQEEILTIDIDPYDFASYDCYDKNSNGFKGYELEKGNYVFSFRTDAHTINDVMYNSKLIPGEFNYTVEDTIKISNDPVTGKEVKNLFTGEDAIDVTPIDATEEGFNPNIPWLTRSKFISLDEIKAAYTSRNATPSSKMNPLDASYRENAAKQWDNATTNSFGEPVDKTVPIWGKNNGLKLAENGIINELGEKLASDYNHEDWNKVLEQVTTTEVVNMINNYYGSKAIDSVGKPALTDLDGPAQIKGFSTAPRGTGYPTMVVIAATWNQKLAYEFGQSFGNDMKQLGVNGLWGWAIDNHRSSFFGRAHESPSEDALFSGTIISNAVKGLNTRGRYCFIKHFSLYTTGFNVDQISKCSSSVFVSEQAYRENYLKAFREAFVNGGALGCMTSYDGIGAEHAETSEALITGVLRREWDFKGAVTTDYLPSSQDVYCEAIIRAGGSLGMNVTLQPSAWSYRSLDSARFQNRLKEVAKQVIYTWLRADFNEKEYLKNPLDEEIVITTSIKSWGWWKSLVICINVCSGLLLSFWAESVILDTFFKKEEKMEETVNG